MLYKFGVTIDDELFVVKYSDRKHVYVTNCTSQRDVDSLIMIAYMIDDGECEEVEEEPAFVRESLFDTDTISLMEACCLATALFLRNNLYFAIDANGTLYRVNHAGWSELKVGDTILIDTDYSNDHAECYNKVAVTSNMELDKLLRIVNNLKMTYVKRSLVNAH